MWFPRVISLPEEHKLSLFQPIWGCVCNEVCNNAYKQNQQLLSLNISPADQS